MTLGELVQKTSYNASRMFGMLNKGHLGVGADADITVLDLSKGEAVMSLASGRIIMVDGHVVGHGGTILTTQHGEERVKASGIPYQLIDSEKSTLYTRSPS
jgi:formylmethanofuran dehydrogenase subunit A